VSPGCGQGCPVYERSITIARNKYNLQNGKEKKNMKVPVRISTRNYWLNNDT